MMDSAAPASTDKSSPTPLRGENTPTSQPSPAYVTTIQAENHQLRAEVEQLRAERARLFERQRRMMELLGTNSAEHLIHDLRNVLNERQLLRTLADME